MESQEDKSMQTPENHQQTSIEEKLVSFEAKEDSNIVTPVSENKSMENEEESKNVFTDLSKNNNSTGYFYTNNNTDEQSFEGIFDENDKEYTVKAFVVTPEMTKNSIIFRGVTTKAINFFRADEILFICLYPSLFQ